MAAKIKTLNDPKTGEQIAPRTFVEAIKTQSDGERLPEILANKASKADVELVNQRVSNLVQNPGEATEGNAELVDIRLGHDGTQYETAGDAVRGQIGELKSDLGEIVFKSTNIFNPKKATDGVVLNSGTGIPYEASSYFTSDFIPVNDDSVIYIKSMRYCCVYDVDKKFISTAQGSNTDYWRPITVGSTIKYIRFSALMSSKSTNYCGYATAENVTPVVEPYYWKVNPEIETVVVEDTLADSVNPVESKVVKSEIDAIKAYKTSGRNLFNYENAVSGKVLGTSDGIPFDDTNNTYFVSDFIPVNEGTIVYFTTIRNVCVYDAKKTFISCIEKPNEQFWRPITSPSTIRYIRFTAQLSMKTSMFVGYAPDTSTVPEYEEYFKEKLTTKLVVENYKKGGHLRGKSVIIFGDSISAGTSCNGGYGNILAKEYGMNVTNLAVNGATVTQIAGQTMDSIINHIAVMDRYEQPDFVIFNGGSNDYDNNRPVGEIADEWDYSEKTSHGTFSDAMEYIIYNVLKKWVGTKIIYLTTHKQQRGLLLKQYFEQAKKVCSKWGVPICNLYENCDLNINILEYRRYTDGGGTHPNADGYMKFYIPMIVDELEKHINN